MKKIKYSAYFLFLVCSIILIGLAVSCKDSNSDPAASEVKLLSFGPCPIPRGAALRIIGTNLDQVKSVVLPGCDPISDIIKKSAEEINVTVPLSADTGKIVLKTATQDITSLTPLTIFGVVSLTDFSPSTAKPGDVIKLQGKDFDFVQEVIFANDIHITKDDFVSQNQNAVEVKVPENAQTGRIAISINISGNLVPAYFDEELNVVLPAITSFSPETIKAGSELTITGTDFDLVQSVSFGGNKTAESFTVDPTNTSITVTVPADAQDGPVVLTAFSGVTVSSTTNLVMVVPTITSITPNPVYAGDQVTITGTDLDLINGVTFGGNVAGDIQAGGTATQIIVNVPVSAKTGNVVFTTTANKTVTSATALTVNVKIQYGPETTIWEGSYLADWNGLKFPASDFVVPANSMLTLYFQQPDPFNWSQGQFAYGDWSGLVFPELSGNTFTPSDGNFGGWGNLDYTSQGFTLTQTILDNIAAKMDGSGIGFIIQGQGGLTFTKATIMEPAQKPETAIWEGTKTVGWGDALALPTSAFASVTAGSVMTLYFTTDPSNGWPQAQICEATAGWPQFSFAELGNSGTINPNNFDNGGTSKGLVLTQDIVTLIQSLNDNGNCIYIQGDGITFTKVTIK